MYVFSSREAENEPLSYLIRFTLPSCSFSDYLLTIRGFKSAKSFSLLCSLLNCLFMKLANSGPCDMDIFFS